jgi:hypothetical protein
MVLVSGKKPIPDPGSRGQKCSKKIIKKLLNILLTRPRIEWDVVWRLCAGALER